MQYKCIPFLNFLPNMEFPIVDSSIYHNIGCYAKQTCLPSMDINLKTMFLLLLIYLYCI